MKNKDIFEKTLHDVTPLKKKMGKNKKTINNPSSINTSQDSILQHRKIKQTKVSLNTKKDKKNRSLHINQDPSFLKKIKKGKIKISKKIDLHGYSLVEAEKIFEEEIEGSYFSNTRLLLFVTGKGVKNTINQENSGQLYHGKIRSNIQRWVYNEKNKRKISYFSQAHPAHGGAGSFYVYIRKKIT